MKYSLTKVKEEMPDVKVRMPAGQIVNGHLSGKNRPKATVTALCRPFETSWESIVESLNTGKPLLDL